MALDEVFSKPWTRKPASALIGAARRIVYPRFLGDLFEIWSKREPNERLHVAVGHWPFRNRQ